MTQFKDLSVGDRFDFAKPNSVMNSFYDRCIKTSARGYRSLDTFLNMRVGSATAKVYNINS